MRPQRGTRSFTARHASGAKVEEQRKPRCKIDDERKAARKIEDERKAAGNAKAVLGCLRPTSARTDRLMFILRNAANMAKTATLTRLESKRALDGIRAEAAGSLNATCALLDRGRLTQEAIDEANRAVVAWMKALPSLPPNHAR